MPDSRQKAKDKKRGQHPQAGKPAPGGQERQAAVPGQNPLQRGGRERNS